MHLSNAVPLINEITLKKWLNPNNISATYVYKNYQVTKVAERGFALIIRPATSRKWADVKFWNASRTLSHALVGHDNTPR